MAKIERIHTVTDLQTGELVASRSNVYELRRLPDEPTFIKMYVNDLGSLLGLQATHRDILLFVAAGMNYYGVVSLTATTKARIALTVGCNEKTVRNAITEYVKAGILRRIGRAEYELDPHLFAKGEWSEIRERRSRFRLEVEYGEEGRKLRTRRLSTDEAKRSEVEHQLGQQRLVD